MIHPETAQKYILWKYNVMYALKKNKTYKQLTLLNMDIIYHIMGCYDTIFPTVNDTYHPDRLNMKSGI